jgi:hypothetical protein
LEVDYVAIRHGLGMRIPHPEGFDHPHLLIVLGAATLGTTRLIDNVDVVPRKARIDPMRIRFCLARASALRRLLTPLFALAVLSALPLTGATQGTAYPTGHTPHRPVSAGGGHR